MTDGSRGVLYGLGFAQVALTLGCVLYSPPVIVYVYHASVSLKNQTLVPSLVEQSHIHVGPILVFVSLFVAFFTTITYQSNHLPETHGIGVQDYQIEALMELKMWDMMFWLYALSIHCLVVLMLCTPASVFGTILGTLLMTYFLARACAPRGGVVSMTYENFNLLGMGLGFLCVCIQISGAFSNMWFALFLLVASDYLLGIGHVWDSTPTMDTIINCRLFYVCSTMIAVGSLYAMYPDLRE
jgi:hypothetical protein